MKFIKFNSSYKKIRNHVASLLRPFNFFCSRQKEFNKQVFSILDDLNSYNKDISDLLHEHDSSIKFLEVLIDDFSRRFNILRWAVIILSISVFLFWILYAYGR